jgi:hypothetical protein
VIACLPGPLWGLAFGGSPQALLRLAAWQSGHGAPCRLGRPAMGSDSTISRSGRQGLPLPDTDLAQAAGSNFLSNISLESGSTGYVEGLVRLQAEASGDDSFWISVVPPKIAMTRR